MKDLINTINKYQSFTILIHRNPDGDAIGSAIALKNLLEGLNKDVNIFTKDNIPPHYMFLPDIDSVSYSENLCPNEVVILIECSTVDRSGYTAEEIDGKVLVNIDHHITNDYYADVNLVNADHAATAESIYYLYNEMGIEVDKDSAICMYVGILTDTNRFQNINTHSDLYPIVKELVDKGVNINEVYKYIYGNRQVSYLRVLGYILNHFELHFDNKVSIVILPRSIVRKYNVKYNEMEGIIEYLRDINGVEVSVLIKEINDDITKVSFRSTGNVQVDVISRENGGGGHKFAAGCELREPARKAKTTILKALEKII